MKGELRVNHDKLLADGWSPLPSSAFASVIGTTYARRVEGAWEVGMIASEIALNEGLGIVHGGALTTFADVAFGFVVARTLGVVNCVTTQLQFQFTAPALAGSYITCRPEIVRRTSQLVFVRGLFEANGRVVGSADAIFMMMADDKMGSLRGG